MLVETLHENKNQPTPRLERGQKIRELLIEKYQGIEEKRSPEFMAGFVIHLLKREENICEKHLACRASWRHIRFRSVSYGFIRLII